MIVTLIYNLFTKNIYQKIHDFIFLLLLFFFHVNRNNQNINVGSIEYMCTTPPTFFFSCLFFVPHTPFLFLYPYNLIKKYSKILDLGNQKKYIVEFKHLK